MSAFNISDQDVAYAESILLRKGESFDSERVNFIKNLQTLDLQAVPGSGKTTVVLAKLLILERYMPFDNCAGLLVLSHTNTAVNEIKERIGAHCPKLFSYPNFVGTIQGFVDEYLTKPYYAQTQQKLVYRICDQTYSQQIDKYMKFCLAGNKAVTFKKAKYIYLNDPSKITNYRFGGDVKNRELIEKLNGNTLKIKKPKPNARNYTDYTDPEKKELLSYLYELKMKILKDGILHFDDAYFLAERYISRFPEIIKILQRRFKFVFVDEMQDMDYHQYDLLEKLFFTNSSSIYQRIGDRNQAIFNGNVRASNVWVDRGMTLNISGSHRLSSEIASLVNNFSVHDNPIVGLAGSSNVLPHMLVFKAGMENQVIDYYYELMKYYQLSDVLPTLKDANIYAISWVAKEKDSPVKLTMRSYYPNFKSPLIKHRIDHSCLEDYLYDYDNSTPTLNAPAKSIVNALLKCLRLSGCRNTDDAFFNESSLMLFLKEQATAQIDDQILIKKIYQWAMSLIRGDRENVFIDISTFIKTLYATRFPNSSPDSKFLNDRHETLPTPVINGADNNHNVNGITINTVHSVKGQTHFATLYMETFNNGNFESTVLKKAFGGNSVVGEINELLDKIREIESEIVALNGKPGEKTRLAKIEKLKREIDTLKINAKMVYVGFSRATNFLCYAVEETRFANLNIDPEKWQVRYIGN